MVAWAACQLCTVVALREGFVQTRALTHLQALDHIGHDLVLQTAVLALRVFSALRMHTLSAFSFLKWCCMLMWCRPAIQAPNAFGCVRHHQLWIGSSGGRYLYEILMHSVIRTKFFLSGMIWTDGCACQVHESAHRMTTMSRLSWRVLVLGMEKPCTRFTCRSSCFRSCTFSDCVLVLSLFSGVNRVPFRHTPLRWMDASTSPGTTLFGLPSGPVPDTLSNLHTDEHGG